MSFFPNISQRYPIHKLAAFLSILSASFYLVISGAPKSAVRAWMMGSAAMIAVISDARVLTVRNLSIVLFVMLLINPANIFYILFQLSAIATFFIIGLFETLRPYALKRQFLSAIWRTRIASRGIYCNPSTYCVIFSDYYPMKGVANLVAVPFTGFVIMPVAIIYLFLVIIGLGDL
jgi:competence protein ComEC